MIFIAGMQKGEAMGMGITVEDFKYVRGVNDSEYIVKNAYERQKLITGKAIAKLKEQPEIIYCKDCKWYKASSSWNCKKYYYCARESITATIKSKMIFVVKRKG